MASYASSGVIQVSRSTKILLWAKILTVADKLKVLNWFEVVARMSLRLTGESIMTES